MYMYNVSNVSLCPYIWWNIESCSQKRVEIDVLYLRILFTTLDKNTRFNNMWPKYAIRLFNGFERFDCAINLASEAINFVFIH